MTTCLILSENTRLIDRSAISQWGLYLIYYLCWVRAQKKLWQLCSKFDVVLLSVVHCPSGVSVVTSPTVVRGGLYPFKIAIQARSSMYLMYMRIVVDKYKRTYSNNHHSRILKLSVSIPDSWCQLKEFSAKLLQHFNCAKCKCWTKCCTNTIFNYTQWNINTQIA